MENWHQRYAEEFGLNVGQNPRLEAFISEAIQSAREEGRTDAIFGREHTPSFKKKWGDEARDALLAELEGEIEGKYDPRDEIYISEILSLLKSKHNDKTKLEKAEQNALQKAIEIVKSNRSTAPIFDEIIASLRNL